MPERRQHPEHRAEFPPPSHFAADREREHTEREALQEVSSVLDSMLHGPDGWPIPRLAPRLTRLEWIVNRALRPSTERQEPPK